MAIGAYANSADRDAIEREMPWADRDVPSTIHQQLTRTRDAHPHAPAITFQLTSNPRDTGETLTWSAFHGQVTQVANLLRSLGIGERDVVAYVLPNATETAVMLLAGAVAGIVSPVNPLLEPGHMAAILRETGARVVVTLKAMPRTELAARVAEAVALAPAVHTVLEVDLARYVPAPKRWLVPALRPRQSVHHQARVLDLAEERARHPADRLTFAEDGTDRVAAMFHTGGTTGMPKVARHRVSGMLYNGWLGARLLFQVEDVILCPLPLFHVFAAYPILMSAVCSGAQVVFPTPAGYRGEGVFDNLWKIIAARRATYLITVPTALAALMQRKVDADVSSLRGAFSGSAALPVELYGRFEAATGVQIIEGYGLTECTCLVAVNPPDGMKKVGSVGLPFPYTEVRILRTMPDGRVTRECAPDEIGEICVSNPGVIEGSTYTEEGRNLGLYADRRYLRTGDLGRLDADGYLWITGRQKDLIIRGGHNIDPAEIEAVLSGHEAVALVGAIGQPDAFAGELPCAYVELVRGATATAEDLLAYARGRINERAAMPRHIEVLRELPKTAVGKVFKPDLRRLAIARVYDTVLSETGARVVEVVEDGRRGLVARIARPGTAGAEAQVRAALADFATPWDWA